MASARFLDPSSIPLKRQSGGNIWATLLPIIQIAIMPLREPTAVTLRARLRPGTTPVELQQLLADGISVALRGQPTITLEELDGPAVVVKISATPVDPSEGGRLASELLEAASQRVDERVS